MTLTTVPDRLNTSLPAAIRSISASGYDDYEIHLNLPRVHKMTGEKYFVPEWAQKYPKLRIFSDLADLGPKTKFIPTVLRIDDPDAVIITADDDILYHKDMIQYHVDSQRDAHNVAFGFSGTKAGRLILAPKQDMDVDILDNYKTASYRRSMFGDDFFSKYASRSWNDDIVISAYLHDKGIRKTVLSYKNETFFHPRVKSFPIVNLVDNPMTGCDLFRGHANKSSSPELQVMYERAISEGGDHAV